MDRIALISDIHGNMPAFEAVLDDIQQREITRIYALGDLVGKGPSSPQVIERCRALCQVSIRGNWDDGIARDRAAFPDGDIGLWYHDQLSSAQIAYLRGMVNHHDLRLSGRHIRLVHASPQGEHRRVHPGSGDAALRGMFDHTPFTGFDGPTPDIVIHGDIHAAYLMTVDRDDRTHTLANVGSVGNPLDFPLASYVVLSGVLDADAAAPFGMEFVRLAYDIDRSIAEAEAAGLPTLDDYTLELRTAVYRGYRRR